MTPGQRQLAEKELLAQARDLQQEFAEFPINLGKICSKLELPIVRDPSLKPNTAFLQITGRQKFTEKILLPISNQQSKFERFCIAHEIAHALLWRNISFIPKDKSEYWILEEICNKFAGELLIPLNVVKSINMHEGLTASEFLWSSIVLSHSSKIHWTASAIRIAGIFEHIEFFRIIKIQNETVKIVVSTLKNKKEIGRHINPATNFGKTVFNAFSMQPQSFRKKSILMVKKKLIDSSLIPSFSCATEAAIIRGKYDVLLCFKRSPGISELHNNI